MKTNKTIILMIMLAALSVSAIAQNSDSEPITVTATVDAGISLTKVSDVAFGTVLQSVTATIDPTGASHSNVTSPTIGEITVGGANGASVDVSWNTTTSLTDAGGANAIAFTASLYQGATTADTPVVNGVAYNLAAASSKLFIGGSITTSTVAGSFSTANTNGVPLTVSIVYN